MRFFNSIFVFSLLALTTLSALEKFETGDRIVLIGDSITHGGSYHGNLYLFYATRFPEAPFCMFNCGIAGDTAPGTNRRFDSDIAIHKPNIATVMLGMNDAWSTTFSPEKSATSKAKEVEKVYSTYTTEMEKLAASLQAIGCRMIFIRPSIYDQTAELDAINHFGKNDMLGRFAAFIDQLAVRYDAEVVDFYSFMISINARLQEKDPSATIISPDRVHPDMAGHFVMSYAFLEAQNMPEVVSSIRINAATQEIEALKNCSIEPTAEMSSEALSFSCREAALPFPIKSAQDRALDWIPFEEKYNQQKLLVSGLESGRYELRIDGMAVGTWTANELATGINLADNPKTPQYQQAQAVMAANDKRLKTAGVIRSIVHVRHSMFHLLDPSVDIANECVLESALRTHVDSFIDKPWHAYLISQVEEYFKQAPNEADLRTEEMTQMKHIWTLNKPRTHHWVLTRQN